MISPIIVFVAFFALALLTRSRTYYVLFVFSLLNLIVDQFTKENDLYLMGVYSSIDFFTCTAILAYGDIHKLYQSIILLFMIVAHSLMEFSLVNDFIYWIESDAYIYTISVLILLQMIGVKRDTSRNNTLSWFNIYFFKDKCFSLFNSAKSKIFNEAAE